MARIPPSLRAQIMTRATRGEKREAIARELRISVRSVYYIIAEARIMEIDRRDVI